MIGLASTYTFPDAGRINAPTSSFPLGDGVHIPPTSEKREGRAAAKIEVRREAAHAFDRELREALSKTVWHTGCTSWYLDENGNDPNQWPWLWHKYRRRAAEVSPETYELKAAA